MSIDWARAQELIEEAAKRPKGRKRKTT